MFYFFCSSVKKTVPILGKNFRYSLSFHNPINARLILIFVATATPNMNFFHLPTPLGCYFAKAECSIGFRLRYLFVRFYPCLGKNKNRLLSRICLRSAFSSSLSFSYSLGVFTLSFEKRISQSVCIVLSFLLIKKQRMPLTFQYN